MDDRTQNLTIEESPAPPPSEDPARWRPLPLAAGGALAGSLGGLLAGMVLGLAGLPGSGLVRAPLLWAAGAALSWGTLGILRLTWWRAMPVAALLVVLLGAAVQGAEAGMHGAVVGATVALLAGALGWGLAGTLASRKP